MNRTTTLWLGVGTGAYVIVVQLLRRWRRAHLNQLVDEALDGTGSVWRVHNILTANELQFEALLSMSARGLLSTYAIPSISGVLLQTQGFSRDVKRRYADMELLIREFNENAADGETRWDGQHDRARIAIQRLNAIHDSYGSLILQQDMKYVLSVFMCTPAQWCRHRGGAWAARSFTAREEACVFRHWVGIGEQMRIASLHEWTCLDDAIAFKASYEQQHQRHRQSNQRVAFSTVDYFINSLPGGAVRRWARPLVLLVLSFLQENQRTAVALGLPPAPLASFNEFPLTHASAGGAICAAVDLTLRARAIVFAWLVPPWPLHWTARLTSRRPVGHVSSPSHSSPPFSPPSSSSFSSSSSCPFAIYAPTRPLDFGNDTYTGGRGGRGYCVHALGAGAEAGKLETDPRYAGERKGAEKQKDNLNNRSI